MKPISMAFIKTLSRLICSLALISSTAGCYGTKVPPPEPSPTGPSGLTRALPSATDLTIPDALPELLLAYRQQLLERNRHISPNLARRYADAEVKRITKLYAGREAALKSSLKMRLQAVTPAITKRSAVPRASGYPSDMNDLQGEQLDSQHF